MTDDLRAQLIRLRKERRVTQEELAHDLGVAQGTVSRWENGSRLISPEELAAYARVLGMRWVLVDVRPVSARPPSELENP